MKNLDLEETMNTYERIVSVPKSMLLSTFVLLISVPCWPQAQPDNTQSHSQTARLLEPAEASEEQSPGSEVKPAALQGNFLIGSDDVLAVNVWKEAEISRTVTVRPDGKISLPLVGELQASTKTPKQLQEEISAKLSAFVTEPAVSVIVQEIHSQRFNILGKVDRPGSYPLTEQATVLDAIAIAGGFRDFAKQKSIYVLRRQNDGVQLRIAFNYKDVIQGKHLDQNIRLQSHDTVVVP
ncbi:MAG: polysaccharide biosynthesis/export family protein [Acidobacteria bacterium]|nr:polysaccharide biosynthesis/export family protein [Acidobacteriota bacterium]